MNRLSVVQSPSEPRQSVPLTLILLLAIFFALWFGSLDQYLFVPLLAIFVYLRSTPRQRIKGPFGVLLILSGVVLLGIVSIAFSEYTSNAIRTVDVWGSTLLLVLAASSVSQQGRSIIVRILLWIWIASLVAYAVSQLAPGVTDSLIRLKLHGPASSVEFWSATNLFGRDLARPAGFALYANEFALFGLVISTLFVWHERPRAAPAAILLGVALLGIVMSTSRTLILTTVVALALFLIYRIASSGRDRKLRSSGIILGALVLGISLVVLLLSNPDFGGTLATQLVGVSDARLGGSKDLRQMSYQFGYQILLSNPLTGVGGLPQLGEIQAGSHDLLLSMGVRHGLPGVALVFALLATVVIHGLRNFFASSWRQGLLGMALLVGVWSSLTIQFDDDVLSFSVIVLAVALTWVSREESSAQSAVNVTHEEARGEIAV